MKQMTLPGLMATSLLEFCLLVSPIACPTRRPRFEPAAKESLV